MLRIGVHNISTISGPLRLVDELPTHLITLTDADVLTQRSQRGRISRERWTRILTRWTPDIRGGSRMREMRPYGFVRGVPGDWHPYRGSHKLAIGLSSHSLTAKDLQASPPT